MSHFWVELHIGKRIAIGALINPIRIFVQYLISKIGQFAKAIAGQNGLS